MENNEFININPNETIHSVNLKFLKYKNYLKHVIGICFSNNSKKVFGVLTLGDLRRIYEKEKNYDQAIKPFINKDFFYLSSSLNKSDYNNFVNLNSDQKDHSDILILDETKKLKEIIKIKDLRNKLEYKKTCVIGLGHVGLPLAVHIANKSLAVIGYDIDKKKINLIKKESPFYEKDLNELRQHTIDTGSLHLTSDYKKVQGQIYILCIGTELIKNKISNKNLKIALTSISKKINTGDLIILRGTMWVEQTRNFVLKFLEEKTTLKAGDDFYLSYCPERLVQGNAMQELKSLPQIISGATDNCKRHSVSFWAAICNQIIEAETTEEAEIIKLASNSYRDLQFAFSNEICRISSKYNLEVLDLIKKANIGYERNNFKNPSPGVGGSCLTKDPILFSKLKQGNTYRLGNISRIINSKSINSIFKNIKDLINQYKILTPKILIFGVTYKGHPETSDLRSSTSIDLGNLLFKNKITYNYFDLTLKKFKYKNTNKKFIYNEKLINKYDFIIIMNNHIQTEENIIKNLKYTKKNRFIYDCWDRIQKEKIEKLNYKYLTLSKKYF